MVSGDVSVEVGLVVGGVMPVPRRIYIVVEGVAGRLSVIATSISERTAPVVASQSLTVLSLDADATSFPSGENATALA